ncbi:MAG: murB [Gammaproteobacteria bacterium]|nr:murB [Gammaproteobacteria bacterium]
MAADSNNISVASGLRGRLLFNEPLANYTSWRIGGPADSLYLPADLADLSHFLAGLPMDEPLCWLGLGSNTLVRDKGVRGTVIVTQGSLNELSLIDEHTLRAEAGVSCGKVARTAARHGLTGAEFLAGIPGTMGGALRMNAGCHDGETWDYVAKLECLDRQGNIRVRMPHEYQVTYRHVTGPENEWFVAVYLQLPTGDKAQSLAKIKELLARRAATQPTGDYSCGSVFRNPPNNYAAKLIEACGLKGTSIGDAMVSTKHANFIVNNGQATAAEVEALIDKVATVVKKNHDIALIREVHVIGES